jgi:AhpD family alkylhydroperoxidase
MPSKNDDVLREIKDTFGLVPEWVGLFPEEAIRGFWTTMRDFHLAETKIPNKYKELIGLAVSGATRCRYCTLFHTEAAKLFGATDDEIREASAMSAHTMNASTFLNSMQVDYDRFRKETLECIANVKRKQSQKPTKREPVAHA